ncbi:hypothetical protein JHK84_035852 [Glycine max]|nr:hypothetical protein JHK87_035371 [Glycine soja]KAG5129455.1 hypothetical protein JHK84_035852 [Glycine max]KHN13214.1 hypothetical protein glysoja_016391 [Glycine soja]
MKQNMMALLIGLIGAALTLFAYSQTFVSPGQCITLGLIVLMLGLLVGEGMYIENYIIWPFVNSAEAGQTPLIAIRIQKR